MIYTANYHLPQWVEEDRIIMEDINDAMAGIDQGLQGAKAAADTAESKADAAQAAAETADSKADAAQSTADNAYCPDNKPYVTGQYTCQSSLLNINLGFKPTMVIVAGDTASTDGTPGQYSGVLFSGYSNANASITNDGFSVGDAGTYPNLAQRYRRYYYIAFR